MKETTTPLKNIFFQDDELFRLGEKHFNLREFDKALDYFIQFSEKSLSSKIFVAGRIAITHMKLGNFETAKELLRESIEQKPDKERDYISLMGECLYDLGRFSDALELCGQIFNKFPDTNNFDIEELEIKMNFYSNLDVLRSSTYTDKEYNTAMENIINVLINDRDNKNEEEAYFYATSLINSSTSESTLPYTFLWNYYKERSNNSEFSYQIYVQALHLLEKLEKSFVLVNEKNILHKEILSVYEKSPCYLYSKYCIPAFEAEVWNPLSKVEELRERAKSFANLAKAKYLPVLNLDFYFAGELQLAQA